MQQTQLAPSEASIGTRVGFVTVIFQQSLHIFYIWELNIDCTSEQVLTNPDSHTAPQIIYSRISGWLKPSSSTIISHICSDHGYLHNYTHHFIRYGSPLFTTALKLKHAFLKVPVKVHQRMSVENRQPLAPPRSSLQTVTCS